METSSIVFAAILVILAGAIVAFVVRHWGAGFPNRSVHCPEKGVRATISTFSSTQFGWGRETQQDVLRCSLLGDGPVTCSKKCLAQLT